MSIKPETIKLLRQKTGAGMMDCKKALSENEGDIEKAEEWLRKKRYKYRAKEVITSCYRGSYQRSYWKKG